jgi:hypothetical protein
VAANEVAAGHVPADTCICRKTTGVAAGRKPASVTAANAPRTAMAERHCAGAHRGRADRSRRRDRENLITHQIFSIFRARSHLCFENVDADIWLPSRRRVKAN